MAGPRDGLRHRALPVREPHFGLGGRARVALVRDAWLFFGLLLLLAVIVLVVMPARYVDRWAGTRLVDRLITLIETVAEL